MVIIFQLAINVSEGWSGMQRTALREARELKGWTLEEAAEYIGVDKNTVWRWEQGISVPYTYHTERICRAYGLTAAQLGLPQRNPRKGPPGRVKTLLKPRYETCCASLAR